MKQRLFEIQDKEYKSFQSKLLPTVSEDRIIGVRTPELRKLARELAGTKDAEDFLCELPHKYYEEDNLHAFVIEQINDFDSCIAEINAFWPYVDNWGTCDSMRPKCFKKNKERLLLEIDKWLSSSHTYTLRFGIETLMLYYLDDGFKTEYHERVAKITSQEYYVNMMIAWYFATALANLWDETLPYIEKKALPIWVHNKAIQKAVESYRITNEQKEYLKKLRMK